MFFPLFLPLFSPEPRCDCADKIINYLEDEKYEWVPRQLDVEQSKLILDHLTQAYKDVDDNPFFLQLQKRRVKDKLYQLAYFEKKLKEPKGGELINGARTTTRSK